jgi:hypothetical protein
VTESVDPNPYTPGEHQGETALGGRQEPADGDPTAGGKRGQIGETGSIAEDEPDDGGPAIPVGGGQVTEESNTPPAAGPGPEGPGTRSGAGSRAGDAD